MNRIILPFRANRYAMNYGYIIMKNNLRTIYDESMGGRPRKKTNAEKTGKMSLRPLFLILFLLTALIPSPLRKELLGTLQRYCVSG